MSLEEELMSKPDYEYRKDLFRSYGSGKFGNYADAYLYEISLEGGTDESVGDAESDTAFDLVKGPFEHRQLKEFVGAILHQNSQGFVGVEWYTNKKKLASDWKSIVTEVDRLGSED